MIDRLIVLVLRLCLCIISLLSSSLFIVHCSLFCVLSLSLCLSSFFFHSLHLVIFFLYFNRNYNVITDYAYA